MWVRVSVCLFAFLSKRRNQQRRHCDVIYILCFCKLHCMEHISRLSRRSKNNLEQHLKVSLDSVPVTTNWYCWETEGARKNMNCVFYHILKWPVSFGLNGIPPFIISPINALLTLLWWFSGHLCWQAAIKLARVFTQECYTQAPGVVFLWMRLPSLKYWNLWAMPLLLWASGTLGSGQTGHFFPPGRGLTSTSASLTPMTWWVMKS